MLSKILDFITGYKKTGIESVDVGKAVILFFDGKKNYFKTVYGSSIPGHQTIWETHVGYAVHTALGAGSLTCDCGTVIYPSRGNLTAKVIKKESFEDYYEKGYTTLFGFKDCEIFTKIDFPKKSLEITQ